MNRSDLADTQVPAARWTRRHWLGCVPAGVAAAALTWESRGFSRSLTEMTAQGTPLLTGCQVGFTPSSAKRLFVRDRGAGASSLNVAAAAGFSQVFPVESGGAGTIDAVTSPVVLTDLKSAGSYRASLGAGQPFAFEIAPDVWSRALPILAGYAHSQRCGHSDRAVHALCHLDDARRRDTAARVDTTGGWHDAGDLRKWVDATLMNLFGLAALVRNLPQHPAIRAAHGPASLGALLEEIRYGNTYFLKMQDADGLVWADVGGGVRGDNSDNHWTDNTPGNDDDRWINVEKRPAIQAMFVTAQAIVSQIFTALNPAYSSVCLDAAWRCWRASSRKASNTTDVAWWTLAATEMSAATRQIECRQEMVRLANQLTDLQVKNPAAGTSMVRGFFPMWVGNQEPLRDSVHSALPAFALLSAARSAGAPAGDHAGKWHSAVRLYLEEYATPMMARSAYNIMPYGLFLDAPADEQYHALSHRYSFRFFMPMKGKGGYTGLSSHLLSHSLLFAAAAVEFQDLRYREHAYSHLEWVFGANPFGASLVTGIGYNQPPVFSPFVGSIPGGIVNGIAGNEQDQPVLNQESAKDWHTNEYWSPHSGYCLWALSFLEAPRQPGQS